MRVYWLDEQRTVLVREFAVVWTWDEYKASIQSDREMLASVQHDVLLIHDCHRFPWLSKNAIV